LHPLTNLKKLKYHSKQQQQPQNHPNLFIPIPKHLPLIFLKLPHTLHNIPTFKPIPPQKQITISPQTLQIYPPLP
ncbi:hypothetical protein, partial [Staphylococcus aureus]|uniref:hypothetical protein n=1 Tax=Staphylococcus aureus TaxID=1280 RepID=UPI001C92F0EB